MMPVYRVKYYVKYGPVTLELTELIMNVCYDTAKNLAFLAEYLGIY